MTGNSLKSAGFALLDRIWRAKILVGSSVAAIAALAGFLAFGRGGAILGVVAAAGVAALAVSGLIAAAAILKLRNAFREVSKAIDKQREEIDQLRNSFRAIQDIRIVVEERTNVLAVQNRELQNKIARQRDALKAQTIDTNAKFERVTGELTKKASDEAFKDLLSRTKGHHIHDRTLSKADVAALRTEWAAPLAFDATDINIGYLASRVRAIESLCTGRLATSTRTMVARLLAAQALGGADLKILEIGVLFGVASACFYDACAGRYDSVHMTLVDPLAGYYKKDAADVTGVAVTRAALERNLAATGVPKISYEIIVGLSNDRNIIAALSQREFDLLLIDGDHSYDGVKRDYENFAPLVRAGGIILFDDYAVSEWPDIKKFVDETPAADSALQLIAAGFRTAAFRVVDRLKAARR